MKDQFVTRFPLYTPSGNKINGKTIAVGVDIDGCVDPGMHKHETAFAIATVMHFKLQILTPVAIRAWMYVNCYSINRGISRFSALFKWADIMRATSTVKHSGVKIPDFTYLRRWTKVTNTLSPNALCNFVSRGDFTSITDATDTQQAVVDELRSVLDWSEKVDLLVKEATQNLEAFPFAAHSLRHLAEIGVDVCAISGTPEAVVIRQLERYGILHCFRAIFAQEAGKKQLALTTIMSGEYENFAAIPVQQNKPLNYDICCMIGDAPQDYQETKKANLILSGAEDSPIRMYLVQVDRENQSWHYFLNHILDELASGSWSKKDELDLITTGLDNLDRVWDPEMRPIESFQKRSSVL